MHNEGKSFVPDRFIRTLNNIIHKYMDSISQTVYSDKLLINTTINIIEQLNRNLLM